MENQEDNNEQEKEIAKNDEHTKNERVPATDTERTPAIDTE